MEELVVPLNGSLSSCRKKYFPWFCMRCIVVQGADEREGSLKSKLNLPQQSPSNIHTLCPIYLTRHCNSRYIILGAKVELLLEGETGKCTSENPFTPCPVLCLSENLIFCGKRSLSLPTRFASIFLQSPGWNLKLHVCDKENACGYFPGESRCYSTRCFAVATFCFVYMMEKCLCYSF